MGLLVPSDWQAVWVGDATSPPPDSQAHNGYRSENASKPDEVKWVCVDLQRASEIDSVALFGARPYNQIPPDAPGHLFPIRFRILTASRPTFPTLEPCATRLRPTSSTRPGARGSAAFSRCMRDM